MLSFEDMSEADTYNAWEEDMATLNIFFGQETVMGDPKDSKKQIQNRIWDKLFLNPVM